MRTAPLLLVLLAATIAWAQPAPGVIHSFDDLMGVKVNNGGNLPATKLVSEGGVLHASTVSPVDATGNTYLSVVVTTPPVDVNNKALVFEAWTTNPKITQALYVRGYDAKGQTVLSWLNWSGPLKAEKTTFDLHPGLGLGALQWEPGVIKNEDRSAIVKWEFYVGTHDTGAAFDLYLDNFRTVASTMKSFADTKDAHAITPETPLVSGGQPQIVLYAPVGADWQPVVDELCAGLEKALGKRPTVIKGDSPEALKAPASHALLLGHVGNNLALLYPYSHYMTAADGSFPGAGGYELRTACDPWGNSHNAIIIGASDPAGAKAGVAAFLKAARGKTVLPRLLEVKPSEEARARNSGAYSATLDDKWMEEQKKSAERALQEGAHTGLFGQIASVGDRYVLTGRDEYARLFVWLCRRAQQHTDSKPTTFGGPWGMDSDFMGHRVIPLWDAVEESPAITPEERLEVARILFRYIREAALPEGAGAASAAKAGNLPSNHGTFAALATFLAGEYFDKYYHSAEAKQWVLIGDECFQSMARFGKAHEDCNGYQWLTNSHVMRYALSKPDLAFFENGNARKAADYAIVTMNNLGYQVPYGDTGAWTCWFSELPVLRMAEWFYRDGTYRWCVEKKMGVQDRRALWEYDPGTAPGLGLTAGGAQVPAQQTAGAGGLQAPARLATFLTVPLDEAWWKHSHGEKAVPLAKAFDKIAFRDGFDPKGAFLLLDGLSNGGHRHMDGNSVLQWTENERVWVADADYIKSLPKYHNGVLILRDGQSATIPDLVELEKTSDHASCATATTTYRNYAGVDWRRHTIWLKGRMFVVADQMVAKQPGDYSFRAIWQTVGNAKINGNAMDVEQGGQWARFATTADAKVLLDDDPGTGKNWSSYPYAGKPIVRVMQGIVNRALKAGESVTLFTVLDCSGERQPEVRVGRLDDNRAVITGDGQPVFVQTGPEGVALKTSGVTEQTIKSALWAAKPAAGAAALAALKPAWSFAQTLDSYLLTNNADAFEAVDAGVKLSCSPQPLARNVFAQENTNTLDNLLDGVLLSADGSVMWDNDQVVTVDLAFDNLYDLSGLRLREWFATSSSKGKTFQLGRLQVLGSTDGFKQDQRTLVDFTDTETHGNWGQPGYGPQSYVFDKLSGKVKQLRLILTPRPGTAIYLSELQVWGSRPGLAVDLSKKLAAGVPTHVFNTVKCVDLNGDGKPEVLAGSSSGTLYCFTAEGKTLWKTDCGGAVNSVNVVDFNGDGKLTVAAGCMEARLVALDPQGKVLWVYNPPYYKRAAHVRVVFPADLQGNGKQSLVIGSENWHYFAVNAQGKEIWRYESVHGSTAGTAADLDGDKKDEIIAGTEYYWWHVINPDGKQRFSYSTKGGPCVNAVAAGDVNGDGKQEAFFGAADTLVHCLDETGKLQWTFNTGDEVQAVQCADVNGDAKPEVLIGSLSMNLYCVDGAGKALWRQDLGSPVKAVTVAKSGGKLVVAAGCDDGTVRVHDAATGQPVAAYKAGGRVLTLSVAQPASGPQSLIVTSADGNLVLLPLP